MLVSNKPGMITNFSKFVTKEGKNMIKLTYTSGNSETLQHSYLAEGMKNYEDLEFMGENLLGKKIVSTIEIEGI